MASLYKFMEGKQAALEALYAHLGQDRQHKGLFKLADRAIVEQRFFRWSMAFQTISSAMFERLVRWLPPS